MAAKSNETPTQFESNDREHRASFAAESSPKNPAEITDKPDKSQTTEDQIYSIFTRGEKWTIVIITSVAGLFSPLTATVYFSAIPAIAAAFHQSAENINLTVTVYMILQGVSPMLWGTIADRFGRRPVFLACLLTLCLSCVGLALMPTSAYWLLLLLRCIQAAGSASTIALGAGVIGDISVPSERGGFFGLYTLGPMVGPCLGPVLGGLLADKLGWRSIFWFLCITSAACLLFVVLFLPETLRALVGDGSYTPSAIYRPLVPIIGRNRLGSSSTDRPPLQTLLNPLRLFTYYDILLLLFFNGVVYSVFYAVIATIAVLFKHSYPFLTETDIGFCFLAIGGGMIFGSLLNGKFLDREYRTIQKQMIRIIKAEGERDIKSEDVTKEENFPIERARLRTIPIYLAVFVVATVSYGWCLQKDAKLAATLVVLVAIGYTAISILNTTQTLIVDLAPSQSSSVTACNNLVRCSLGAAMIAVIDIIINALDTGWTFVLLGGICTLIGPSIYLSMWLGPRCRSKRRVRTAVLEVSE